MVDWQSLRFGVLGPALLRLALLSPGGALTAFVFGTLAGLWGRVVGLAILLAVYMGSAGRLAAWLEAPRLDDIPNGFGLWADVFARLYRQRRAAESNDRGLLQKEGRC